MGRATPATGRSAATATSGSPIPVWKSDDPEYPRIDVYGSLAELERDFGRLPRNADGEPDLHRPYIDDLTRPNPDDPTGRSTMRRIPDVLDVWFDSGSMPFAQVHYPFENQEWFDTHNPADFIVEYIGQTRGWFYVHARAVDGAVRPAGVQERRQPRHRARQRRAEDVEVAAQLPRRLRGLRPRRLRRDALVPDVELRAARRQPRRHRGGHPRGRAPGACCRSGARGTSSRSTPTPRATAGTRRRAAPTRPTCSTATCSRSCATSSTAVTADLEELRLDARRRSKLRDFADVLTNWYVRRSRDRFWAGVGDDGSGTRGVRHALHRARDAHAPRGAAAAAHHRADLAGPHGRPQRAPDRLARRRRVPGRRRPRRRDGRGARDRRSRCSRCASRPACGCGCRSRASRSSSRGCRGARAVRGHPARRAQREVGRARRRSTSRAPSAYGVTSGSRVNARAAGPRLGKTVQKAIQAARVGDWSLDGDGVVAGGIALGRGEYDLVLEAGGSGDGSTRARAARRRRLRDARHRDDPRARGRGPRARRHPRRAGRPQGGRPRRERPHPPRAHARRPERRRSAACGASRPDRGETLARRTSHVDDVRRRVGRRRRRAPSSATRVRRYLGRTWRRRERRHPTTAIERRGARRGRRGLRGAPRAHRRGLARSRGSAPTRRAVELLGDPHRAAPVIHITGTNGKTSTSRMIESLLRAYGLRTGLLTSPHLERFTERIRIDGEPIADEAVARNWEDIAAVRRDRRRRARGGGRGAAHLLRGAHGARVRVLRRRARRRRRARGRHGRRVGLDERRRRPGRRVHADRPRPPVAPRRRRSPDRAHEVGHHQAGGRRRVREAARRGARRCSSDAAELTESTLAVEGDAFDVARVAGRRRRPARVDPRTRGGVPRRGAAALRTPPGPERRRRDRRGRGVHRRRRACASPTRSCTRASPPRRRPGACSRRHRADGASSTPRTTRTAPSRSSPALDEYFDFDEIVVRVRRARRQGRRRASSTCSRAGAARSS